MPRIIIDAWNDDRIIKNILVNVRVDFKNQFYSQHHLRASQKLSEIADKIEAVIKEYFDDCEREIFFSDYAYKKRSGEF